MRKMSETAISKDLSMMMWILWNLGKVSKVKEKETEKRNYLLNAHSQ